MTFIINLRLRQAELYLSPQPQKGAYSPPLVISEKQALLPRVGDDEVLSIPLRELLP